MGRAAWRLHTSSRKGFSELRISDSRFRADTPGTWPAQICSMRTRRCAMVARKPSTCRGRAESSGESASWRQPCSPSSETLHRLPEGSWGPGCGDSSVHHGPSWPCPRPRHTSPSSFQPPQPMESFKHPPGTPETTPASAETGSAMGLARLGKLSGVTQLVTTELASEPGRTRPNQRPGGRGI